MPRLLSAQLIKRAHNNVLSHYIAPLDIAPLVTTSSLKIYSYNRIMITSGLGEGHHSKCITSKETEEVLSPPICSMNEASVKRGINITMCGHLCKDVLSARLPITERER